MGNKKTQGKQIKRRTAVIPVSHIINPVGYPVNVIRRTIDYVQHARLDDLTKASELFKVEMRNDKAAMYSKDARKCSDKNRART